MGRHAYKFTEERRKQYLELVRNGTGRIKAAFEVGLNSKTIDRHIASDSDFDEQRETAEMHATDEVEESMFESARSGNYPAAIRWLETKRPEVWKPTEKPELGSALNPVHVAAAVAPGTIDWDAIPDDLADRFLALHAELVALQPASGGLVINQDGSPAEPDAQDVPF